jgi:methylthioribose-1-phosphate isomerase
MKFSELFWPIQYKKGTIFILDETKLPHKLVYIKVRTYQAACRAIKEMKTRAVGQVILVFYIFLMVLEQNKNRKNILPLLQKVAACINATRPTLSFQSLTEMVLGWAASGAPLDRCIGGFLDTLKDSRMQQADQTSQLICDGDCILTHCNISGLLPLVAELCRRQGKRLSFYVTETRPYLQGSRLTAWELQRAGVEVTVIADNMVAQVMAEGKVHKVIVGADHLTQNGDIANKVGTLQIAILAKHFNIPFYVICPPASGLRTGQDIAIEVRPEEELLGCGVNRSAPKGVKGYYPAFDVTPHHLITKHIFMKVQR